MNSKYFADHQMLRQSKFCDDEYPVMAYNQRCDKREYIKVRFTSDQENATTGFYGYFVVLSEGKCLSFPKLWQICHFFLSDFFQI